jgi:tRNA nucleotidyltransferase/poly(A) polymerase
VSAISEGLRESAAMGIAAGVIEGPAWVVGGAVRDAAVGRPVIDADLAVEPGAERETAEAIARAGRGAAFRLSEEFGTWRAVAPTEGWHVDVSRLRGEDIRGDLGHRDFTINAIAVPLADLEATPIDPHDGLGDLERRVVRAVSERSFADDPLRLLRAARIAAALEFEIEARTVELARAEAARAAGPAGERRLAELRLLVSGADPIRAFELLDLLGATAGVLPELEALHGVEQNPNHHLDVHVHTI